MVAGVFITDDDEHHLYIKPSVMRRFYLSSAYDSFVAVLAGACQIHRYADDDTKIESLVIGKLESSFRLKGLCYKNGR